MKILDLHLDAYKSTRKNEVRISNSLCVEETKLLLSAVPEAYKTQINDILLTALVLAYGDLTGEYSLYFNLEGHGREYVVDNVDLSRTVGWFTSLFPVFLNIENPTDISLSIKSVKEQLRKIPNHGIGFGILSFLTKEKEILEKKYKAEIAFNYLGQLDRSSKKSAFLKNARESYGECSHPKNERSYPIEISAYIKDGVFEITWFFNTDNYTFKTLETFSACYMNSLKMLISHCVHSDSFGYVPSDFPLAKLNQQTLDTFFGNKKGIEDIYPLSPLQSGLLFHTLANEKSDAYLVQTLYTFKGSISLEILNKACNVINDHYIIFKTGFVWEHLDFPLQFVQKKSNLAWQSEDWSYLSEIDHNIKLKKLLAEDRQLNFDFSKPPLSRWFYIKISDVKSYLLWTHHHILLDGWSGSIILSQLIMTYKQLLCNKKLSLTHSPSYKEYIRYHVENNESNNNEYEKFWRVYLNNMNSHYYLHNKLSIYNTPRNDYDFHTFEFSEYETDKIKECAKSLQVTVNTLIQGAWALLLSLYTQSEDVIFGVTVSGRNIDLGDAEQIVGLFINTLPLRVQVLKQQELKDFLVALQLNMAHINTMASTSLAKVKSYANSKDVFNTILIFENFPKNLNLENLSHDFQLDRIEAFEVTEYPLSLTINLTEILTFNICFKNDYFDKEGIAAIVEYFVHIISQMKNDENGTLQELMTLTPNDRYTMLKVWNNKMQDIVSENISPLLHEIIGNNCSNKTAICYLDQKLTYRDLNYQSNQIAHYLTKTGLVTHNSVGICLERSVDLVVVMLAVLKAGGYYVPLDPTHPQERLRYILEDSETSILITSSTLSDFYSNLECSVLYIDELKNNSMNEKIVFPIYSSVASDTVYTIYTSGSTGSPKGVIVSHQNLINLLNSMEKKPGIIEDDCFLALTTVAFDISGLEIWLPLISGAQLTIASARSSTCGIELGNLINESGTTLLQATPATFQMLLDSQWKCPRPLKLLLGGDILPFKLASFLLAEGHDVWNLYGPTETTIWSTTTKIVPNTIISIGKPIDNTEVYILDKDSHLLPTGIVGELCIGGAGVAKGYLKKPELTAEKFINNPFSPNDKSRIYKTGDYARYLGDGNILYVGRIDNQIKIRGYRIEPGEIEVHIEARTGVQSCVVVAKRDRMGENTLVAYISLLEKEVGVYHMEAEKANALREFLRTKIPEYMIPNYFIVLEELPLNINGKIDREKLPELEYIIRDINNNYLIPKTELEKIIHKIWVKILCVDNISINDNFFYLGGDSIVAIRFISQARSVGLSFEIRHVFNFPTIYELAKMGENILCKPQMTDDHALSGASTFSLDRQQIYQIFGDDTIIQDVYPLAPMQSAFIFMIFSQKTQESNFMQNIYEINSLLDKDALKAAWAELFEQSGLLRTGFLYDSSLEKPLQYVATTLELPWFEYDLTGYSAAEQQLKLFQIIKEDVYKGFKLNIPPLVRLYLIYISDNKYNLILSYHHILMDGWSIPIFIKELKERYFSKISGLTSSYSKNTLIPYRNYIDWLLQQDEKRAHDFWHTYLKEFSATSYLESTDLKSKKKSHFYHELKIYLTKQESARILALAKNYNVTLNTLMQVSWGLLLYHHTGKSDILFGVTVSGRNIDFPRIEELLGLCINTLPLRLLISDDDTLNTLLHKTQKNMSEIQEYAYFSLAKIKGLSEIKGSIPLFNTIFVFENYQKIPYASDNFEISLVSVMSKGEYPLGITIVPGDSILFKFDYCTDDFSHNFVENLGTNMREILASFMGDEG